MVAQPGMLPPQEGQMVAIPGGQPFFSTRQRRQVVPPLGKGAAVGESLNSHQRKQEMSRILLENEALLKRLQNR